MSEFAIPRNFETDLHAPNATARFDEALSVAAKIGNAGVARQISIMLHKNLATHRIYSLSKRPDNLHLWRVLW